MVLTNQSTLDLLQHKKEIMQYLQTYLYGAVQADKLYTKKARAETFYEKSKRYDTSHLKGDQPEPGSRRRVLKNKFGITSKRAMDRREKAEQIRTMEELTSIFKIFAAVIRKTLRVREQQ